MRPFASVDEARMFFYAVSLQQKVAAPRSCLIRFQVGVRRVTFDVCGTYFGAVVKGAK